MTTTALAAPPRARTVVRLLLAALALTGVLGSVASTSVASDERTLVARAQAGDVAVLQLERPLARGWAGAPSSTSSVAWVDRWGVRSSVEGRGLPPGTDLVATVLAAAPPDAQPQVVRGALLRDRLDRAGDLALVVLLVLLLTGPQPRRLTKWGWTWVLAGVPACLGLLLHLWREAPWSRETTAEPELPAGAVHPGHRSGGGTALACVVALNAALVLLVVPLELLPQSEDLQPRPFSAVQLDGTSVPQR